MPLYTGNLPAPTGSLATNHPHLRGELPEMSGKIGVDKTNVEGNLPAQNGVAVGVFIIPTFTGSLPAQNGVMSLRAFIKSIAGSLPAMSGALQPVQIVALTGDLPQIHGEISPTSYLRGRMTLGGGVLTAQDIDYATKNITIYVMTNNTDVGKVYLH